MLDKVFKFLDCKTSAYNILPCYYAFFFAISDHSFTVVAITPLTADKTHYLIGRFRFAL